jgi:hypothetical protein
VLRELTRPHPLFPASHGSTYQQSNNLSRNLRNMYDDETL